MSEVPFPTVTDVEAAARRLRGLVLRTPLVRSPGLSRLAGADIRIKLESVQETRSFKVRGAGNALAGLRRPGAGVVTYSTGNHGRATAWLAGMMGIPATVCVSRHTTADQQQALRELGARLLVVGESQDEAATRARRLAEDGLHLVDPIDDPATTAGHGTIALELLEDWPELDTVVVPVSGGALISGIAAVIKARSGARVVGVSMERGAAMYASLAAGSPVEVPEQPSLAASLQGGIGRDNTHTLRMVGELVDEIVLVDETAIARAMAHAVADERLILEGAGATPLAAVMTGAVDGGERVALVGTGAMVDAGTLCSVLASHAPGTEPAP